MRRIVALALAAALLAGGCTALTRDGTRITAEFETIGDLVILAEVQLADADVGTVTDLTLDEESWTAIVTMEIHPGVQVPRGSGAVVRSTSLLGEKFVDLEAPPEGTARTAFEDGGHIPLERTGKAPEVEAVFQELGGILASGALADLGTFTSAIARIVEGQEERIGNVIDGTQLLVESLARRRESLASALDRLESASGTLAGGTGILDRFLQTSREATRILGDEGDDLADLVVQLDRLGESQVELVGQHADDIQSQIDSLVAIIEKAFEVRDTLDAALTKLPQFATFFAAAAPGDYVQLDIAAENPLPVSGSAAAPETLEAIFTGAAR